MSESARISSSKETGDKQSIRWRWWVVVVAVVDDSGTNERMREKTEKIDWLTSRANRFFLLILYVRTNRTIAIIFSFLFLSLSVFLSLDLSSLLCSSSSHYIYSTIISLSILGLLSLFLSSFSMDNNPLTPRASNFSIASLITSDGCEDENSLYHSLTSPIGTPNTPQIPYTHPSLSIEKITNDYYHSSHLQPDLHHFRAATLTETNNGQCQPPPAVPIKENRSTNHKNHPHHHQQVTNLQKSLTTIRNMEGEQETRREVPFTHRSCLDYIQSATEKIKSTSTSMLDINKSDSENGIGLTGNNELKKPLHPKLANIKLVIESKSLWDEFDKLGTEMIVTRSGR